MVNNLSEHHSLVTQWVSELRDIHIQKDRYRFRRNLERIAEVMAYEISKTLPAVKKKTVTPLGVATTEVIEDQPILATILRAGLAMHQGLLNYFDNADSAFLSAYRKYRDNENFDIAVEYVSSPNIKGKTLIISDPMLATGASLVKAYQYLIQQGSPKNVNIVCALASQAGINYVSQQIPTATIWCAAIDDQLDTHGYIIPGLGDAGDLAYGKKN